MALAAIASGKTWIQSGNAKFVVMPTLLPVSTMTLTRSA